MPSLFNGYCYATLADAAKAEISLPPEPSNIGLSAASNFVSTTATTGQMTYIYKPMAASAQASYVMTRVYPSCPSVGYLTNYSGVELVDAVVVSWLVILVWVTAFAFKSMRRPIR